MLKEAIQKYKGLLGVTCLLLAVIVGASMARSTSTIPETQGDEAGVTMGVSTDSLPATYAADDEQETDDVVAEEQKPGDDGSSSADSSSASSQPEGPSPTEQVTTSPSKPKAKPKKPKPQQPDTADVGIALGTLTFDNFPRASEITFTLPVTLSAKSDVTMTVFQEMGSVVLCKKTVQLAANAQQVVSCHHSATKALHHIYAIVTAGGASERSSYVYIGGVE